MVELRWTVEEQVVSVVPLRSRPLLFGRSSSNDVALTDPAVSGRHFSAWVQGEQAWVEDLGSRNGTLLNGERLQGLAGLAPGDVLRVGATELRVHARAQPERSSARPLMLEDLDAGVAYPLHLERVHLGSSRDADIVLDGGPAEAAVLLVHCDGQVQLGVDDDLTELAVDAPFEVSGRRFVLRAADPGRVATVEAGELCYPYRMEISTSGPRGLQAELVDLRSGRRHQPAAENRRALLFLLAKKAEEDQRQRVPAERVGWCDEGDLAVGVWGRGERHRTLNVLLCRLRQELRGAGFDGWCIERKDGCVRVRVQEVALLALA